MNRSISFCTTATIRPEIIRETYQSFKAGLQHINMFDCELFINVDPAPVNRLKERMDVIKAAQEFFGRVTYNLPDEPNFAAAVKWCWSMPTTEFLFNLEDDWLLNEPVDMNTVYQYFELNPKLCQVALRAYTYRYRSLPLSPSILRRRCYSYIHQYLNMDMNPEVQLQRGKFGELEFRNTKVLQKVIPNHVILTDIGRPWLVTIGLSRPDKKHFTRWN